MNTIDELRSSCMKASCELEKISNKDANIRVLKNNIRNTAIELLWAAGYGYFDGQT